MLSSSQTIHHAINPALPVKCQCVCVCAALFSYPLPPSIYKAKATPHLLVHIHSPPPGYKPGIRPKNRQRKNCHEHVSNFADLMVLPPHGGSSIPEFADQSGFEFVLIGLGTVRTPEVGVGVNEMGRWSAEGIGIHVWVSVTGRRHARVDGGLPAHGTEVRAGTCTTGSPAILMCWRF